MSQNPSRRLLELGFHPVWLRTDRPLIDRLESGFKVWLDHQPRMEGISITEENLRARLLVEYLGFWIREKLERMDSLRAGFTEFSQRHAHAATQRERETHIMGYAKRLGATPRQLTEDRKAIGRWFGYDAMAERFERRYREAERELVVVLGRLGVIAGHYLETFAAPEQSIVSWRQLRLEKLLRPLLAYEGDSRVRIAAFESLAASLLSLPHALQERAVTDTTLRYIYRSALERRQEIWIQCAALSLLQTLSTASLISALEHRLESPGKGDDLFVRRRAMRLLGQQLAESPELESLLFKVKDDPSPAVRQLIVGTIHKADSRTAERLLEALILHDQETTVRAATLLGLRGLAQRDDLFEIVLDQLRASLATEQHRFVLRVGLRTLVAIHHDLFESGREAMACRWHRLLSPALARLHRSAGDLAVRRWAAEVKERMWVVETPSARSLSAVLREQIGSIPPRQSARLKRALLNQTDRDTLGRTLACLAQREFDLEVESGILGSRLRRGARLGFRAWRLWHEWWRPATDKRQGFPHTTGRVYRGSLHAPSAVMAELAETRVPGEPLYQAEEAGHRPYLPLVDEVISALDAGLFFGKPLWLYSAEGVTEVRPPDSLMRRLMARVVLTLRFDRYARQRNWREGERMAPTAYAESLRRLGIEMHFTAHRESLCDNQDQAESETLNWGADPAVVRFFPGLAAMPFPFQDFFERLQDYFYSVYQNNIKQLLLFLAAALVGMFGRHLYLNARIRSARRSMPLVIGGWGTRGKSGTERLKAALINAKGYAVLSKTTGCEAMFLHAHPNGRLREMMLFRPYDKATIWEQANLVRLGQRLNIDVFLWECMGLTPSYVGILQQQWMKDDLSTITNTYPDHEDLQGPAGYNIPEVMTNFIPENSVLITTEEQMLPILRASARSKQTRLRTAGWLQSGLLPPDILQRFPYEEHPDNIALVLELADELGLEEDYALKEMADRVVPDLGVLKTSPPASVTGRRMEFINGMSANERFGCLSNWQRTGFADHDPYRDPDTWLATVVNNRADREPRSQVFAAILVEDIAADHHFLIGTNLDGLRGYIRDAWGEAMENISLFGGDGSNESDAVQILEKMAQRFRLPYRPSHVQGRLRGMLRGVEVKSLDDELDGLWDKPDSLREKLIAGQSPEWVETIVRFHRRQLDLYKQFGDLAARLQDKSVDQRSLERRFKAQLWRWFWGKFTVIEDPHSSGEQVIRTIVRGTPPGLKSRVMGLQNIKGTGLDFVYRWQAWELCHRYCAQLDAKDPAEAREGLRNLSAFQDYGQLSEETVREVVERVRHRKLAQNELFQAELRVIITNLEAAMKDVRQQLDTGRSVGLLARFLDAIEAFLDSGDAIRRRKLANRIYRDLQNERISHERAARELQTLNKRQKEGWLKQRAFELASGDKPSQGG
ncbi:MAG: HEAT repeat domain-containing protein [Candidatus Thiodiazotropha sp. (ex Dulcina madagascariensis)]|nr:HEAT repeat domain-containing protein [Candidatus Thiodiazotropha sp. (ex Dulcina madagascariensis)]